MSGMQTRLISNTEKCRSCGSNLQAYVLTETGESMGRNVATCITCGSCAVIQDWDDYTEAAN